MKSAIITWLCVFCIAFCVICSGCVYRKPSPVPPVPTKTPTHIADAQKVAGALTDKARTADEMGLIPRSTDSGTLVKLAVTNEQYVGSPAVRVDAENSKAIDALINSMQKQEEQYRQDRAAWELRIDALSRDRDRAEIRATGFAEQVSRLKNWLFWGCVLAAVACFLCPGLLWVLVRFFTGRVRAHLGQVVEGVDSFIEKTPQASDALKAHLSRAMDTPAKRMVKQIKIDRGM